MKKIFICGCFDRDLFSKVSQKVIEESSFYCDMTIDPLNGDNKEQVGTFLNRLGANPIISFLKESDIAISFRVKGEGNYPDCDFSLESQKDTEHPDWWRGISLKNGIQKNVSCIIKFEEI